MKFHSHTLYRLPIKLCPYSRIKVFDNKENMVFDFAIPALNTNQVFLSFIEKKNILNLINNQLYKKVNFIENLYIEGLTIYFDTGPYTKQELLTVRNFGFIKSSNPYYTNKDIQETQLEFLIFLLNKLSMVYNISLHETKALYNL